jgi:transcriptional regulator of acetoin/glycerol metabolism
VKIVQGVTVEKEPKPSVEISSSRIDNREASQENLVKIEDHTGKTILVERAFPLSLELSRQLPRVIDAMKGSPLFAKDLVKKTQLLFNQAFRQNDYPAYIMNSERKYLLPNMRFTGLFGNRDVRGLSNGNLFNEEISRRLSACESDALSGEIAFDIHEVSCEGTQGKFLHLMLPVPTAFIRLDAPAIYGILIPHPGEYLDLMAAEYWEEPSQSPLMKHVYSKARLVAKTDSIVLLMGESGAGKDFLAEYIHKQSRRADGPFVILNCGAIPKDLAESEFFGHEKGAFTGATSSKKGAFEIADGGTIVLNEIGEMRLDIQVKLLTFLDKRRFKRVGGEKELKSDVRIIAVTNKDLVKEVSAGNFRLDLYHRLSPFPIEVLPLRKRIEDMGQMVAFFVTDLLKELKLDAETKLHPSAIEVLQGHSWPGNIRELRNVLQRALILSNGEWISPEVIIFSNVTDSATSTLQRQKPDRSELEELLREHNGNISKVAAATGWDRTTVTKWVKGHGLQRQQRGRPRKSS